MLSVILVFAAALAALAADQYQAATDTDAEFQYVISEDQEVGSVVADLVADASLHRTLDGDVLDALVFDVFHGPHSNLFDVDSPSGIVRVKRVIDRDVICYKQPTCTIPLDVAIIRPSAYFRVCAPSIIKNNTSCPKTAVPTHFNFSS